MSEPMAPPAPGRLSTTICWPMLAPTFWAMARASRSVAPLAGNGTISRIGLDGYVSACDGAATRVRLVVRPMPSRRSQEVILLLRCGKRAGRKNRAKSRLVHHYSAHRVTMKANIPFVINKKTLWLDLHEYHPISPHLRRRVRAGLVCRRCRPGGADAGGGQPADAFARTGTAP
ncbi:hypothetical protein D3C85_1263770 [compost metagenome]